MEVSLYFCIAQRHYFLDSFHILKSEFVSRFLLVLLEVFLDGHAISVNLVDENNVILCLIFNKFQHRFL